MKLSNSDNRTPTNDQYHHIDKYKNLNGVHKQITAVQVLHFIAQELSN
jgi:hypothetical protein